MTILGGLPFIFFTFISSPMIGLSLGRLVAWLLGRCWNGVQEAGRFGLVLRAVFWLAMTVGVP